MIIELVIELVIGLMIGVVIGVVIGLMIELIPRAQNQINRWHRPHHQDRWAIDRLI